MNSSLRIPHFSLPVRILKHLCEFLRYSPLDGSLRFLGNRSVTGQDVLGKYDELHMMYVANDVNIHYETVTRFYSYDFPVLTLYAQVHITVPAHRRRYSANGDTLGVHISLY